MKFPFPLHLVLLSTAFLTVAPLAEAKDKHRYQETYSSDRARDIRQAREREQKRREEAYRDRRSHYDYYRSGYNYYPGYRSYGGYYYGRPRTTIAIGVAPSYSTQYMERDRPVYRGVELRDRRGSSLEVSVQKKLGRLGYYRGSYDGDIGPASRRAILRYQRDNDLRQTGRIDRDLVESLGLS